MTTPTPPATCGTNELAEILDEVTSALETVMIQFGPKMTPADQLARWRKVERAQTMLAEMKEN